MTRPTKKQRERRRRDEVHRKRLLALGMSAEALKTLSSQEMRKLLKRPAAVAKKK